MRALICRTLSPPPCNSVPNSVSLTVRSLIASALGKNRPVALTKSDPHEEHDLPVGKKNGELDIIHAEGERFAIPSSAPQARNLLSLRHALVKPISQPRVAA